MNKDKLRELLSQLWLRDISADEAFDELEDLINHIKRLEEAGDKLEYASVISEAGEDPNGFEKLLIAQREWREAKEAKL